MNEIIIFQLQKNINIFLKLFSNVDEKLQYWKPHENQWCLLEILCHLLDKEREDFRVKTQWAINQQGNPMPVTNSVIWSESRDYLSQSLSRNLQRFMIERETSVHWLKSITTDLWNTPFEHPEQGSLTAKYFLTEWLAHDFIHLRQIIKLKHDYLTNNNDDNNSNEKNTESLRYAGNW